MTNSLITYRRRAGAALLAGAALNVAACTVSVASTAGTHVPSDLARAPMTHDAAIVVYVLAAIAEALLVAGLVWLRRSGLPRTRGVWIGLGAVIAGTVLLSVCNVASIPIEDQLNNSTAASWVWSGFAVGSLLAVGGMITAGVSISAHSEEPTWRDHAALICGLLGLLLIAFQVANIVWLGIVVYSLGYALLGVAQLTAARDRRQAVPQPA
ncbi:MAG TPA: hypothetical protein VGF68_20455 [Solirubrobacteraceae bacterium]|jgi:hypothetical protein